MKRVEQTPCPPWNADARLSGTKRRKDDTSTDYETPTSDFRAVAPTRSDSETTNVSPVGETERVEDAATESSFPLAATELHSQITGKINELLALDSKERDLYSAELLRLQTEVKRQCVELEQLTKHTNSVASERDKLQVELTKEVNKNNQSSDDQERLWNDKKRLQSELDQKEAAIQKLNNKIAEMIAEKGRLLVEKKKFEGELVEERSNLNKLSATSAQQNERVIELTTECHRLLTEIGERGQQIERKNEELSNLKADMDKFSNECGLLKKDKEALLDETDRLNDMLKKLREELKTEKDSNSRELAKRDELMKQVDAELSGLRTEHTEHLDNCKSKQDRHDKELTTCRDALERKNRVARLVETGYALRRKKDFLKAYALFDEAIALDADTLLPHVHKATGYYEQTNYKGCVRTCTTAMTEDRVINADRCTLALLYELAAGACVKLAGVSQASVQRLEVRPDQLAHLDEAVQFYGRSLAHYYDVEVERKHKHSEQFLRQAYTNPELSQSALERGNEFVKTGNYQKALEEYNEAVKRNPGNTRLYLTRAWCHRKLQSCGKAIEDYKRALELDPSYAAAYTKLGAAYQHLGQRQNAEKSYKKALELDPGESEAERALKDLHSAPSKHFVQGSGSRK